MNVNHIETLQQHHLYNITATKLGSPANLNGCMMIDASIKDLNLSGIYFNDSNLMKTSFRNVKLEYAVFAYAYLKEASFKDCVMQDVSFNYADLTYSTFENVDLAYTTFISCDLTGANFSKVTPENLEGVNFSDAICHHTGFPNKEMKIGKLYKTTKNSFLISKNIQDQALVCLLDINSYTIDILDGNGTVHKNLPNWLKYSMKEV